MTKDPAGIRACAIACLPAAAPPPASLTPSSGSAARPPASTSRGGAPHAQSGPQEVNSPMRSVFLAWSFFFVFPLSNLAPTHKLVNGPL